MIVLIVVLIMLSTSTALADGGFFPPGLTDLWEHEQSALLQWDADQNQETLAILPGFRGDAREFAWVVPVPALPQVDTAEAALFEELFRVTAPLGKQRGSGWACDFSQSDAAAPAPLQGDVDILLDDLIGIYDVMVLSTDQASSLVDSLDTWGYLHDGNSDEAEPILAEYVDQGWVFVTMRVDSAAFHEAYPDAHGWQTWTGGLQPIELTFPCDAPIYPMRISAVSADDNTRVTVFTVADRRLDFDGAQTRYANRITGSELRAIRQQWGLVAGRLAEGVVLTRLERTMGSVDMDADLLLVESQDQGEYRPIVYSAIHEVWLFLGPVLAFLGLGRWRARRGGLVGVGKAGTVGGVGPSHGDGCL